jgi:hypothetical protein
MKTGILIILVAGFQVVPDGNLAYVKFLALLINKYLPIFAKGVKDHFPSFNRGTFCSVAFHRYGI